MRVGIGYDVHPLMPGRKLVLGGVEIPFDKGLGGWSDADVLAHAIMDALLGAAALGDIGTHFPPGDPQYKGISSMILLNRVRHMLIEKGWQVENIDTVVVAEKPKIKDFVSKMRRKLSESLGIDPERVSIKATTSEKMGFAGRGEGIAAHAVALIKSASE